MKIQRLPERTVGQIAAGEVVERPAAVVKELVENAIDAGARRIDVVMKDGGSELIEVRDDGTGIALQDLPFALERHATSKLTSITDLDNLRTLGFRGEALASVGAVSNLTIKSIASDSTTGGEVRSRFGESLPPEATSWGAGTAVTVKHLFRNVPARREFLRTAATEVGYANRITGAYALAYPDIAFTFTADDRRQFITDGRGNRLNTTLAIWGKDIANEMTAVVELEHDHPGYLLTGIISLPSTHRARRDRQLFFAGGRLIQSPRLATAFEQAYHTLLMVGRHPLGCIILDVPGDRVDVNVHPTKSEIRFADDRLVFALVQRATRATLLQNATDQPVPTLIDAPLAPLGSMIPSSRDPDVQRRIHLAHPDRPTMSGNGSSFAGGERAPIADGDKNDISSVERAGRALPVLRVLGQVASTFITAEGPDGLYLIDQHAADERIQFEIIMAEYQSRVPARQQLLQPVVVELTPEQMETFETVQDELVGFGFEIEQFGGTALAVRAMPAILKLKDPEGSLQTILDEINAGGRGDSRLESLAISAACHGSIRAGQALSLLEMRELVRQLENCSSPLACGHGRPTIIRMTADELERQFSRR